MNETATLGHAAREALLVALAVSAPVVLAAAFAGIVVAAAIALVVFGPWMARHVVELAERAFLLAQ